MDAAEATSLDQLTGDEKIIARAKAELKQCIDWEADAITKFKADIKFANADPDNGWQWPNYLWMQRKDDANGYKPRLTINKVRQHNLQIKNEAKKNPPGIKISPVGEKATFKAAQAVAGLIKHIERQSRAKSAYDTGFGFCVDGGIGYIRITTDYVDDNSFDQEIFIRRVRNPENVRLDPDANELDKSDSRFGFMFEDVPTDVFLREHPELRGHINNTLAIGNDTGGWLTSDHVRVAEYFVREEKKDRLVLMLNPEATVNGGQDAQAPARVIARWSKIPPYIKRQIEANDSIIQDRDLIESEIKWYKIAAEKIIDKGIWPGRYIPIVPIIAEEVIVDGRLERKGHTRNLKDAQRMYNFWTSSAVEQVALQTKTRWFVPVGATENLQSYYELMNRQNYPFIPYNALDAEGNALPPPTPIDPPQMSEGYIKGMMISQGELSMASGQREESRGEETNAISGAAINARMAPSETATYHFKDGLATALVQVANICIDLMPHIYDTKQVKRILARDGTESLIQIDPGADAAYVEKEDPGEGEIVAVLNPSVGRYWVAADPGPGYETQRKEAWNAFVQITAQNQELVTQIGDLMFQYADFPGADDIAERLRRLVPPALLGEGPSPDLQAAQAQNEQLKALVTELTDKLAKQDLKLADRQDQKEINEYKAESDRLAKIGNAVGDIGEETLRPIIEKILQSMQDPSNQPVVGDARRDGEGAPEANDNEPPIAGARKAADGKWYVPHPQGGYSQVEMAA